MREILFRGICKKTGKFVCGDYFKTPLTDESTDSKPEDGWYFLTGIERHCISMNGCAYAVDPKTVGEFTGLPDKNGMRIFEGDVIDGTDCFANKGIVKFGKYKQDDMSSGYECGNQGFYVDMEKNTDLYRHDLHYWASSCEVIGNIHENPELLEAHP